MRCTLNTDLTTITKKKEKKKRESIILRDKNFIASYMIQING